MEERQQTQQNSRIEDRYDPHVHDGRDVVIIDEQSPIKIRGDYQKDRSLEQNIIDLRGKIQTTFDELERRFDHEQQVLEHTYLENTAGQYNMFETDLANMSSQHVQQVQTNLDLQGGTQQKENLEKELSKIRKNAARSTKTASKKAAGQYQMPMSSSARIAMETKRH